jgi:integrase
VVIPLHPQLEQFLLDLPSSEESKAFLFPTLAGRKTGGAHGLSRRFADIMISAGIKTEVARPKMDDGEGRAISKLSFHSLRHGFNSAMANKGVSQEIRQKLTGHASSEMNKVYTQHEMERLREAVNVVPNIATE